MCNTNNALESARTFGRQHLNTLHKLVTSDMERASTQRDADVLAHELLEVASSLAEMAADLIEGNDDNDAIYDEVMEAVDKIGECTILLEAVEIARAS